MPRVQCEFVGLSPLTATMHINHGWISTVTGITYMHGRSVCVMKRDVFDRVVCNFRLNIKLPALWTHEMWIDDCRHPVVDQRRAARHNPHGSTMHVSNPRSPWISIHG